MRVENTLKFFMNCIVLVPFILSAQKIVKEFSSTNFNTEQLKELKNEFGTNKIFPAVYEPQILIALSYFPELKNITIEFRLKKTNTPLSSKPKLFGLLQSAKNRRYIVTISEATNSRLEPILFKNLNFNAQVGVLGHELSHVSDYMTKGFGKMSNLLLIEIFSKKQVDSFESRTDLICIYHGLGYQLLEWSKSVRQNLKIEYWCGADNLQYMTKKERYLNPETIVKAIESLSIYNQLNNRAINTSN
jgi:hypothetical protein